MEGSIRRAPRVGAKLPTTDRLKAESKKKRTFDLTLTLVAAVAWVPLLAVCALAILITSGRPVFYVSNRRVDRRRVIRLWKLRVMIKNADKIANRDTVPVNGVAFLNIETNSPLYTRVGRWFERFNLTELPQLVHVIAGQMTLVGSRPLPERVIEEIKRAHPSVEQRFRTRAGIAGPIQLIGRENVSDEHRLDLEYRYCRIAESSYSIRLDLQILLFVVLIALRIKKPMPYESVVRMIERHDRSPAADLHPGAVVRHEAEVAATMSLALGADGNGNGSRSGSSASRLAEPGVGRGRAQDPVAS